jgi:HEXXH motif-containing protein
MIDVHLLSGDMLDQLAEGYGGEDAVRTLQEVQLSKHLLLVRFILEQFPAGGPALQDLLERSRTAAPDRFRAILGAPLVGGWTAIAGRALSQDALAEADRDHLAAIAIVAAAAAGVEGSVRVPAQDGRAVLPGLGAVATAGSASVSVTSADGRLHVATDDGVLTVPAVPDTPAPGWLPVRSLSAQAAGHAIRLGLDDLHPYRHGYHVPPANRLPVTEFDKWPALFEPAWELLAAHLPERAVELTAGLQTLVPLVERDSRTASSATLRHSFGVFGLTLPPTPEDFVVTLVHEFQHSKLSAILDLIRLTDPADNRRFFAPWRTDPRPLSGLLQGVYAFVGVADTWRALQGTATVATARFSEARLQADRGLTAIEESGALTVEGQRFVAGLRRTADRLLAEPVPAAAHRDAQATLARTYAAWRDHNRV